MAFVQMSLCLAVAGTVACATTRTGPSAQDPTRGETDRARPLTGLLAAHYRDYAGDERSPTGDILSSAEKDIRIKRNPSFQERELKRIARRRKARPRKEKRIGKVVIRLRNGRRVVVKKRRKPDSNILPQVTQPVLVSKKSEKLQAPPNLNPTQPSSPIRHIPPHILPPGDNYPAIIVTPRSTQGIISSKEILERNKNKKIETLVIEREQKNEIVEEQIISTFPPPEERFAEIDQVDFFNQLTTESTTVRQLSNSLSSFPSTFGGRDGLIQPQDTFEKLVKESRKPDIGFQSNSNQIEDDANFQVLLNKARRRTNQRLQKFQPQLAIPNFSPSQERRVQSTLPVLPQSSPTKSVRIATNANKARQNTNIIELKSNFEQNPGFVKQNQVRQKQSKALFSENAAQFVVNQDIEQNSKQNSPNQFQQNSPQFGQNMNQFEKNLVQFDQNKVQVDERQIQQNQVPLEQPRTSSNLVDPSFMRQFQFEPGLFSTTEIDQSLFFGPPSTNINMDDGSYTIVTVFS